MRREFANTSTQSLSVDHSELLDDRYLHVIAQIAF